VKIDENWLDARTQNCNPVDPTLDHLPSRRLQQTGIPDHRAKQDSVIVLDGQFSKCLDNVREAWVSELRDETEQVTATGNQRPSLRVWIVAFPLNNF
jgi:hypothetical protein